MLPTIAQLISIVILLVPGFLCIQVFSTLTRTKKLESFDATVLSIVFTLVIHGIYTTIFVALNIHCVQTLINCLSNKSWSPGMSRLVGFYIVGLLLFSLLMGYLIAVIRRKDRIRRFINFLGFEHNASENLWDEIIDLYSASNKTPVIVIHYENDSYAGWVHRSSLDLDKSEQKDIMLADPSYKKDDDEVFKKLSVPLVYLNLSDVKSIYLINGKHILESKY